MTRANRLTCLSALQLGDKHKITTPVNWNKGDDVIVHPAVNNEDAKSLFPEVTFHKVCHWSFFIHILVSLTYSSTATLLEDNSSQGLNAIVIDRVGE